LFDPAYVPADVLSPDGVAEVNAVVERLRARLVDRVEFQEPGSLFRVRTKLGFIANLTFADAYN